MSTFKDYFFAFCDAVEKTQIEQEEFNRLPKEEQYWITKNRNEREAAAGNRSTFGIILDVVSENQKRIEAESEMTHKERKEFRDRIDKDREFKRKELEERREYDRARGILKEENNTGGWCNIC